MDRGSAALNIPAYNGGLFADNPTLDRLAVPDEVCRYIQDLAEYEYRPARDEGEELLALSILTETQRSTWYSPLVGSTAHGDDPRGVTRQL